MKKIRHIQKRYLICYDRTPKTNVKKNDKTSITSLSKACDVLSQCLFFPKFIEVVFEFFCKAPSFVTFCRGAMNNKVFGLWCRRGLLAYVYNSVSLTMNALVVGIGSYIVRPCGHDLHGPTSPFVRQN